MVQTRLGSARDSSREELFLRRWPTRVRCLSLSPSSLFPIVKSELNRTKDAFKTRSKILNAWAWLTRAHHHPYVIDAFYLLIRSCSCVTSRKATLYEPWAQALKSILKPSNPFLVFSPNPIHFAASPSPIRKPNRPEKSSS